MEINNSALDYRNRETQFETLEQDSFDLLVVGGGITGAGIARDAALRGLNVALVEAQDFAAGTSSRSTKLIHGGLRYLAQGDIDLVRESATERATLERLAPHLAQTISFLLPVLSKTDQLKFRTGLWAYEKLGQVAESDTHRVHSVAEVRSSEPALNTKGWHSAITYGECITEDTRLTLANIRSAKEAGATVVSYCKVLAFSYDGDRINGVEVKDVLTSEGQTLHVKANVVVNAAGPWVDSICRMADSGGADRLQLTKGVHIVLPRSVLPLNKPLLATGRDKRMVFVIPKDEITYIGTTDTFYKSADYWPKAEAGDVEYLLDVANSVSNGNTIYPDQIASLCAGIRPLIAEKGKNPSEISRKDETWENADGLLSIAGGKLTAYRRMAERVVDKVELRLGRTSNPCRTAEEVLPGGGVDLELLSKDATLDHLDSVDKKRLIRNYGGEVIQVVENGADVKAEVYQGVVFEGALKLEDYWLRRSGRSLFDIDAGLCVLAAAAGEMSELLGWSDARREEEIKSCQQIHTSRMAWQQEPALACQL